jgi:hypothetical protein
LIPLAKIGYRSPLPPLMRWRNGTTKKIPPGCIRQVASVEREILAEVLRKGGPDAAAARREADRHIRAETGY